MIPEGLETGKMRRIWKWIWCSNRKNHGFLTFPGIQGKIIRGGVDTEGWRTYDHEWWRCIVCGTVGVKG